MNRYQRYFCGGVIISSVFWILVILKLFHLSLDKAPKPRLQKIMPRIPLHAGRPTETKLHLSPDEASKPWLQKIIPRPSESKPLETLLDLSELALIKTPEDQIKREQGYSHYSFNVLISDRLSFDRQLPDVRHTKCKNLYYPEELPSTSVIICFYNEAWSALLRTVHTVIARSPKSALLEIILVDDMSDFPHLGKPLEDYIAKNLPQTKLIRTSEREGLIRARILGAESASGDVLVFLDSHCEVNVGWMEPLLGHILSDSANVAIPIIDIINADTFQYESSPLVRGGFNWGLFFRWDQIPSSYFKTDDDFAKPIQTPTMAGGLFAISREFFTRLGMYDPGLDVWGAENLELSFKAWQCGGHMDIIPCSRVGHIFRKRRPYGSGSKKDVNTHNALRVAHVWMDDYIEYYFRINSAAKQVDYGDISDRVALRKSLNCHSFKWYMDTVYPEQTLPDSAGQGGILPRDHNFGKLHQRPPTLRRANLVHVVSDLCVTSDKSVYDKKSLLRLVPCQSGNKSLVWHEIDDGSLLLAGALCLDVNDLGVGQGRVFPHLSKCAFSGGGGTQTWQWFGPSKRMLLNPATGKCLHVTSSTDSTMYLSLDYCDKDNRNQFFILR